MRRFVRVLALTLLGAALACGRDSLQAEGTIPRERFVEVNVELRRIERDAAEADSLRQAVFERYDITEDELRAFIAGYATRPDLLSAIWHEIHEELGRAQDEGGLPEDAEDAASDTTHPGTVAPLLPPADADDPDRLPVAPPPRVHQIR